MLQRAKPKAPNKPLHITISQEIIHPSGAVKRHIIGTFELSPTRKNKVPLRCFAPPLGNPKLSKIFIEIDRNKN